MSVIWSGVTEEGAVVPVQVTAEGKVVAVGDGPEGEYLKLTGGNLTGDLTINTDKVTLNAENGSATFASAVRSGGDPNDGTSVGSKVSPNGFVQATRSSGASAVWSGYIQGTTSPTSRINGDGSATFVSATFASSINAGSDTSDTGSSVFYANRAGSSLYSKNYGTGPGITVEADSARNAFQIDNSDGTTATAYITGTGSATFAGGSCGFTSSGELFFTSRGARYKLVVTGELCTAEPYTRQMELKEKAEQFMADKPQLEVTPDNDNA